MPSIRTRLLCILGAALLLMAAVFVARAESPAQEPPHEEIVEATVGHIAEEREVEVMGRHQLYQKLELVLLSGARRGEIITVENGDLPQLQTRRYRVGERVFVRVGSGSAADQRYTIESPSRWIPLTGVVALFVAVVVLVTRWRSVTSLLGLGTSFLVLLVYILPNLAAGANPLKVILIGGALVVPVSYFLVHGVSLKTVAAVVGTAIALLFTFFLAQLCVSLTQLTGYASEEVAFLQVQHFASMDIRSLLLAGIVVGVLGVLDDVTVSQAAIVQQLQQANPDLGLWELYRRAMRVGQDHIASMVNTLALVYAGAALPLLLLLRTSTLPLGYLLSQEIIATEIIRMIVASVGLMAAVPLTTVVAAATMSYWSMFQRLRASQD